MHIFKKTLKRKALKFDKNALTAQRLKRLPSILKKLQRVYSGEKATMKLSQMQDIAGCRAVMSNVKFVKQLYEEGYIKGDLKHKKVNEKNYIENPKSDGYRGIHLVYRYRSNKGKSDFNGLLVEIQLRSKLQHIWATSIETVDLFTGQAIKTNEGQKEWVDFFRLVSSAFAIAEKTPIVPNTPSNKKELYEEIKKREKELGVIRVMEGWTNAIKIFEEANKHKLSFKFFLLELDTEKESLTIRGYNEGSEELAISDYTKMEKINQNNKSYDVVLVGTDKIGDLKKAYPNYFVDTKEFISKLKEIINK
jgi:ppGpp synthetase/RelA/SpoT-type nucleotidyltranferase